MNPAVRVASKLIFLKKGQGFGIRYKVVLVSKKQGDAPFMEEQK